MNIYVGNFLGFVAISLFVLSFQLKSRKLIIVCNTVSRFFYVLQYIVLGAFSGAILDTVATVFSALVVNKDSACKRLKNILLILLYCVIVVFSILLYADIYSVFSFLGVSFELSAFLFIKEKNVRIVSLASQPFWFVYNLHYLAFSSVLGNCLAIISIVVSILRYDINIFDSKHKKHRVE